MEKSKGVWAYVLKSVSVLKCGWIQNPSDIVSYPGISVKESMIRRAAERT